MVILPRKNEKDLRDIPEEIRKQIKLVLVDTMDQVLEARPPAQAEGGSSCKAPGLRRRRRRRSAEPAARRPPAGFPTDQPPAS